MELFEIEYVRDRVHIEHFLEQLASYLEGGERPRVFHGPKEVTQVEARIVQKVSSIYEDYERLKSNVRRAAQMPGRTVLGVEPEDMITPDNNV